MVAPAPLRSSADDRCRALSGGTDSAALGLACRRGGEQARQLGARRSRALPIAGLLDARSDRAMLCHASRIWSPVGAKLRRPLSDGCLGQAPDDGRPRGSSPRVGRAPRRRRSGAGSTIGAGAGRWRRSFVQRVSSFGNGLVWSPRVFYSTAYRQEETLPLSSSCEPPLRTPCAGWRRTRRPTRPARARHRSVMPSRRSGAWPSPINSSAARSGDVWGLTTAVDKCQMAQGSRGLENEFR